MCTVISSIGFLPWYNGPSNFNLAGYTIKHLKLRVQSLYYLITTLTQVPVGNHVSKSTLTQISEIFGFNGAGSIFLFLCVCV